MHQLQDTNPISDINDVPETRPYVMMLGLASEIEDNAKLFHEEFNESKYANAFMTLINIEHTVTEMKNGFDHIIEADEETKTKTK